MLNNAKFTVNLDHITTTGRLLYTKKIIIVVLKRVYDQLIYGNRNYIRSVEIFGNKETVRKQTKTQKTDEKWKESRNRTQYGNQSNATE